MTAEISKTKYKIIYFLKSHKLKPFKYIEMITITKNTEKSLSQHQYCLFSYNQKITESHNKTLKRINVHFCLLIIKSKLTTMLL